MEYISISILATIPMIFLLYIVANKFFHIHLQLKTLLLCAACALLISLMVPRIIVGYIGMLSTMAIIIMLAVIFAFYMAYYDDQQEKQQSENFIIEDSLPVSAAQELLTADENTIVTNNQVWIEEEVVEKIPLETNALDTAPMIFLDGEPQNATKEEIAKEETSEEKIKKDTLINNSSLDFIIEDESLPLALPLSEPVTIDEDIFIETHTIVDDSEDTLADNTLANTLSPAIDICSSYDGKQQDINEELVLEFIEPVLNAGEILDEPVIENYAAVDETNDAQPEAVSLAQNEVATSLNEYQKEEDYEETVEVGVEPPVPTIEEVTATPSVTVSLEDEDNITPKSDKLDDLLDYAFEQKEQHNFSHALQAFQKALDLYHKSAVAPFLIVEIATIFKNCGAYDEAIKFFCYGRTLPELNKNLHLDKEFTNSIAYLQITKNILLQENLGSLPFNEISAIIRNRIDSTFADE